MNRAKKAVLAVSALGLLAGTPAPAASIVLTFENLQEGELIANYYNGGLGSMGSGPGPAFGATFTSNAAILIDQHHYTGEPTAPGVMLVGNNTQSFGLQIAANMDVAAGFVGDFSFYYGSIEGMGQDAPQSVKIFSGLDGTGTLLGSMSLMMTPGSNTTGPLAVFTTTPQDISFSGVAHSAVFTGGNQQILFDNIQFTAIPEPASLVLFAQAGLFLLARLARRRTRPASATALADSPA